MFEDWKREKNQLCLKHAKNPCVGDYWHEMFVPQRVVVDVTKFAVVTCESTKDVGNDKWTWDLSKLKSYTRKQFLESGRYGSGDKDFVPTDDFENIKNCFIGNVEPKCHKWVKDAVLEEK